MKQQAFPTNPKDLSVAILTAIGAAVVILATSSCTTPADPAGISSVPSPGLTSREFMRQEQRPFLNQRPTNSQIQTAQSQIDIVTP